MAALSVAAGSITLAAPSAAADSTYPTHPARLIVGYPPGGSTDIPARLTALKVAPGAGIKPE